MFISRRQFLKYCSIAAGAIGLTTTDLIKLENSLASEGGLPVVWLQGQGCTGCTVSLANTVYYQSLQELLLLNQPAQTLALEYHQTLMAATGSEATGQTFSSTFVLAIEGAIPTNIEGQYCQVGSFTGAGGETMKDAVDYFAPLAAKVLTIGTCAAYGGIPAGAGNTTQAKGFLNYWAWKQGNGNAIAGAATANYKTMRQNTINIPGCPPNPNWIVGSIAYILSRWTEGVKLPSVDALRRPRMYYGERLCNYCDRFGNSTADESQDGFVGVNPTLTYNRLSVNEPERIGDSGQNAPNGRCLKMAGCKGSRTKADCSWRKWHNPGPQQIGINWCVGAGAPCQGCTQNFFPDRMSPFHYIR
jgi:hydrogenase small subunit